MGKPLAHAKSSAAKYGGKWEDYIAIHNFMDSSKGAVADNRHRALTHNAWFISPDGALEHAFGVAMKNSDGKEIAIRTIGEQHIMEDFGFIPTAQDWLQEIPMADWMNARGRPPSIKNARKVKVQLGD